MQRIETKDGFILIGDNGNKTYVGEEAHKIMLKEWQDDRVKELEESMICDSCSHFISMHGDNGECFACSEDICKSLN